MEIDLEQIRSAIPRIRQAPPDDTLLTPAGVFLFLYTKDGEEQIILNKRSDKVEHHKGEISFPGGAWEPGDESVLATALREAYEEMGVLPQDIQVLGELDSVGTSTKFSIRPFVGTIPFPYAFRINDTEIAEVLEIPVSTLLERANQREEVRLKGTQLFRACSYVYKGHIIHGATARILTQFLGIVAKSQ